MRLKVINPFSVKTPETLTSKDIATLFIDVFSDFPKVLESNHTFIHGARGTGKSMMLRYLEPKVQLEAGKVQKYSDLEFFAIHIPIKTANYNLAELDRLTEAPYWIFAEHFFITLICSTILGKLNDILPSDVDDEIKKFVKNVLELISWFGGENFEQIESIDDLEKIFLREKINIRRYLSLISFKKDNENYNGTIFDYEDFFVQFIKIVKELSFTPNGPIFLMIDDADNLSIRMQKILNNWVSYRTTNEICLKISTQKRYKTWRTSQDILIESPHDFTEIDINAIYTSKQNSSFYERIEKIVEKRLEVAGIKVSPHEFFPVNINQKNSLDLIKEQIAADWDAGIKRVSSRKSDDITRYAVSEYMKQLELRKKSNLYSYAGFESLINISSGMIRYFLEPASRMFAELESRNEKNITFIPSDLQDEIIKKWSEEYILIDFEKMKNDQNTRSNIEKIDKVDQLKNLIDALCRVFRIKLLSDDSERRFISFMLTKKPNNGLKDILDLAVEWGYLNISTISNKEGTGRNILYTLNRRLTPLFKLDPTGYAAHLSVTPEMLNIALLNPNQFVNERLREVKSIDQSALVQDTLDF
jgi:hypothetical protein